jgi:hypothetical protein
VIIRANSKFIHAVPLPLPFRALGLDASFTGHRGLAMWNPPSLPVTTITLSHGELDPQSPRPSVRVITDCNGEQADAAEKATRELTGLGWQADEAIATSLRARTDVTIAVDGTPTPFALHRHGTRHWVAFASLPDIEVAIAAHATALEDVALITVDADLADYEAAPEIVPSLGDLADARADQVLGWLEPLSIVFWAHRALEVGADVPALHRITTADPRDEERLRRHHEQALDELGAPRLDATQARWHMARSWATALAEGGLLPREAARRIAEETHEQLGRPASLQPLVDAHREVERRGVVTGNLHAALLAGARSFLAAEGPHRSAAG